MKILVTGAGGFIGGHLVKDLLSKGHDVVAVDIKPAEEWYQFLDNEKVINAIANLEEKEACYKYSKGVDRIYNLACNMGGMGFIQNNHALCMQSVLIQTHMLMAARDNGVSEILYSSSACVYPEEIQEEILDAEAQGLKENTAIPANPQDGYGWEKLFSEIITHYFARDFNLNPRICRYHNVYGPYGTWSGGREKAPAAICRKVIEAKFSGKKEIEIWGDGEQTRSFMYIDDCLTGMEKLWASDFKDPINLGSDEMVSINGLVNIVEEIAGIKLERNYLLDKPQGVRGRNSDNTLIREVLNWAPSTKLRDGMEKTYRWIYDQMR
ncbi:MAG: NAD-dependent epimerase/dehydratase family protein [Opitutales bacterium]|nr:NAD-dependent epimerase/dehydratase family protein [Opitutales bacterium]